MDHRSSLIEFYKRFVQFKQGHPETWVEEAQRFFETEARRKWRRYPAFCKAIKHAFRGIPAFHEHGIVEGADPSVTAFFLQDFFPFLQRWFHLTTGIAPSSVTLRDARIVYPGEVIYQCQLLVPAAMLKVMDELVFDFGELARPLHVRSMIHYALSKLVSSLNPIFKTCAGSGWQIIQITNLLDIALDGMRVTVLLSFNSYSARAFQAAYFDGHLLDFIEDTLGMALQPPVKKQLVQAQDSYQKLARECFIACKKDVLGTIKHVEARAIITGRITPFYELLATLISKLDLGITPVQQLLREFNEMNGFSEQDSIVWGYLFDLVVTQALLYETFQSNIAIFKERASQVFMIVLQYFLIDLGRDVLSDKIYRGEELHEKIRSLVEAVKSNDEHGDGGEKGGAGSGAGSGGAESERFDAFTFQFQQFLVNHFKIQDMEHYDTFIKCLLGRPVEHVTRRFFTSFLKTSHLQVMAHLDKLNENLPAKRRLTYPGLVTRISEFLQFCLRRVFLKGDLAAASRQFKDPANRFSEDNIANAMFEILVYRELPFHENQWMATMAVEFRNRMDLAMLADVNERIKAISPGILGNYVIHDQALKPTTTLLHEWFFTDIIVPLHAYHQFIQRDVSGKHLDWNSFVVVVMRFFKEHARDCMPDARVAQDLARITGTLLDWHES